MSEWVTTMQAILNTQSNLLQTAFSEFNGQGVYGLEFILDELAAEKVVVQTAPKDDTDYDWFGLSDLCI